MITSPSKPVVPEPPADAEPSHAVPEERWTCTDAERANAAADKPRPPELRGSAPLHRSASDRVLFGVCGGLADSLQVDAGLVRLAFAIAALWGGAGLLLYVVLAVILPIDPRDDLAPFRTALERTQVLSGVVLIVLGGLLLVSNAGIAPWLTWSLFWPSLAILIGIGLVAQRRR